MIRYITLIVALKLLFVQNIILIHGFKIKTNSITVKTGTNCINVDSSFNCFITQWILAEEKFNSINKSNFRMIKPRWTNGN